jgi:hypothetical protein
LLLLACGEPGVYRHFNYFYYAFVEIIKIITLPHRIKAFTCNQ